MTAAKSPVAQASKSDDDTLLEFDEKRNSRGEKKEKNQTKKTVFPPTLSRALWQWC
jgi:hypothetical protein